MVKEMKIRLTHDLIYIVIFFFCKDQLHALISLKSNLNYMLLIPDCASVMNVAVADYENSFEL